MTVMELKELLDRVIDTTAEVKVSAEDGTFFDGKPVTGIMIMHNITNEKDEARVFLVCNE